MPRVYEVKKARKADPKFGIEVGDRYFYWEFMTGGVQKSKMYPRRQQLTQSSYLIQVYDIEDRIEALTTEMDLASEVEDIISDIENLLDETQGALDNMPEQLQDSSILNERVDSLQNLIDELQNIDTDIEEEKEEDETDLEFETRMFDKKEELLNEIQSVSYPE